MISLSPSRSLIAEESASSETSSVGLGIDWTFLNFGRARARVDAADAQAREALASYEQAVLTALEDTETRLVRYQQSQQRTRRLQRAAPSGCVSNWSLIARRTKALEAFAGRFS